MNNNNVIKVLKLGRVKALRCKECGKEYPSKKIFICEDCFGSLEVIYDHKSIQLGRITFRKRPKNLWRYFELSPVDDKSKIIDLCTGYTQLHKANKHDKTLGLKYFYIKDDAVNPTYSFKERIFDSPGNHKRFLNFYVNGKNVRFTDYLNTSLSETDELTILPSATGG